MPEDIYDFLTKTTKPKNYIIDQLISTDSGFGHSNLGTTQKYIYLDDQDVRKGYEQYSPFANISPSDQSISPTDDNISPHDQRKTL